MSSVPAFEFQRRPSTIAFMLRALLPSPGLKNGGGFPSMRAAWKSHRVDAAHLAEFARLTGLSTEPSLPVIYPHVFGFPLHMVILTHPRFPLPIWGVLQIRNHMLQHAPLLAGDVLDFETRIVGERIVPRGVEMDAHTTVHTRGELKWESLTIFYYRGRFGEPGEPSPWAAAPDVGAPVVRQWRTPPTGGWSFGRFTGDYNGIHWADPYARQLGFRRAFHHSQAVLGQCLAHLPAPDADRPQRLDAWLKGPVYYDSEVRLCATTGPECSVFALIPEGEPRPAVLGRWSSCPPGEQRLIH